MAEPDDEDDEEKPCETCEGDEVIEVSHSGHPLDPDTCHQPCPDCCPGYEKDDDDPQ